MKKKIVASAVILCMAFGMTGCTSGGTITSAVAEADQWSVYDTLEEAEAAAGFAISVPDMSKYSDEEIYRTSTALSEIEICYSEGVERGTYIRKADDDGDISGIYDGFGYEDEISIGSKTVTVKGSDSDALYLAIWNEGGYAYCVCLEEEVDLSTMSELASEVE